MAKKTASKKTVPKKNAPKRTVPKKTAPRKTKTTEKLDMIKKARIANIDKQIESLEKKKKRLLDKLFLICRQQLTRGQAVYRR